MPARTRLRLRSRSVSASCARALSTPASATLRLLRVAASVGRRRLQRRALLQHLGAGHLEGGLGLAHFGLEGARIEPGKRLPLPDLVIEVDQQIGDLPGQLRADLRR